MDSDFSTAFAGILADLDALKMTKAGLKKLAEHIATATEGDADAILEALDAFEETDEFDGVTIMLNYGPKSHAIFGTNKDDHAPIFNEYNKKDGNKKLFSYGKTLAFGPGWTIMDKSKLKVVEALLKKNKVQYTTIERSEHEGEAEAPKAKPKAKGKAKAAPKAKGKAKAKVEEEEEEEEADEEEEKPKPKAKGKAKAKVAPKAKGKAKVAPKAKGKAKAKVEEEEEEAEDEEAPKPKAKGKAKAKAAPKAKGKVAPKAKAKAAPKSKAVKGLSARVNAWSNLEEADSGIIFLELAVGGGGRKIKVAVGKQDADAEETVKGLKSVLPLEKDDLEFLKGKDLRWLTAEMLEQLSKKDATTHKALEKIFKKSATDEDEAEEAPKPKGKGKGKAKVEEAEEEEEEEEEEEAEAEGEDGEAEGEDGEAEEEDDE